jgi:hypothetical protein
VKNSAAFPEPNFTTTPNNFFTMIPDMSDAELRVTLVMFRQTFGWQNRTSFKMGLDKLAEAAGLSRQGALDGAAAAEKRGTFHRANPDTNKEAEWELVVALQPVEGSPQPSRGLSGVKESTKEREHGPNGHMPLDWQIASGKPIEKMPDNFLQEAQDAANLVGTGMGVLALDGYELSMAFMQARHIVFTESQIKAQRKAAKAMLEAKVKPEHVRLAVEKLTEKNMTVTDLFSVTKTAIDLAHPSGSGLNPQGLKIS